MRSPAEILRLAADLDERLRAQEGRAQVIRFPFNGELSADEVRMDEQHAFDGPASWETQ